MDNTLSATGATDEHDFNQAMIDMLEHCIATFRRKRQDYGDDNFIKAAKIASILRGKNFTPPDVAACLIGIKTARYGNLHGREALHESQEDSGIDLIVYTALMFREEQKYEEAGGNKREQAT